MSYLARGRGENFLAEIFFLATLTAMRCSDGCSDKVAHTHWKRSLKWTATSREIPTGSRMLKSAVQPCSTTALFGRSCFAG